MSHEASDPGRKPVEAVPHRDAAASALRNLTESIVDGASALWRGLTGRGWGGAKAYWALKDVSFEVHPGEVVGIIGSNGAGKSTLLKVLSRIAEPTSGRAVVRGRMCSLLEVGTGFHPELTGRENVYLNGSTLGMGRREINAKFDEIVSFAEIEQFLDTPVKRYSSGMYVRLGFSVATSLNPDVLIVDEVLAVGDATFQRRCADRMKEFVESGRTILFVSHNMDLIPRLCRRALLLDRGRLAKAGPAPEIVKLHLQRNAVAADRLNLRNRHRTGDGRAQFVSWWLESQDGKPSTTHQSGQDLTLSVEISAPAPVANAALAVVLLTPSGTRLISSWTREVGFAVDIAPGRQVYRCHFKRVAVRPGHRLTVMLWMEAAGRVIDSIDDAGTIEVTDGPGTEHLSQDLLQGLVVCEYNWNRSG